MDQPETAAERITWAIERSRKTQEALAAEVGCTREAISQWASGATSAHNIKAHLLLRFADVTGTELRWLLTGDGPRISRYLVNDEFERVATALAAMERATPGQAELVTRMVEAAALNSGARRP